MAVKSIFDIKCFRCKILGRTISFTIKYIEIRKHFLKYHSSGFKLFAKGYWQTTKLSAGMQSYTGKYFSVQYIVTCYVAFNLDIHVYVYHKYSGTLNTFDMLCPLNKAKVIFKGSS